MCNSTKNKQNKIVLISRAANHSFSVYGSESESKLFWTEDGKLEGAAVAEEPLLSTRKKKERGYFAFWQVRLRKWVVIKRKSSNNSKNKK